MLTQCEPPYQTQDRRSVIFTSVQDQFNNYSNG
jgi:hypothetical protein